MGQDSAKSRLVQTGPLLSELSTLPIARRCEIILEFGEVEIAESLAELQTMGLTPVVLPLNAERLAWALAFNVDGGVEQAPGSLRLAQKRQGYCHVWPLSTPWQRIWSALNAKFGNSDRTITTLLSELAQSVACEQRSDWQNPAAQPVLWSQADRAFTLVYETNRLKVLNEVRKSLDSHLTDPKTLSDESWAQMYRSYWSPSSERRFLGLCRISTLVCNIARNLAIDTKRRNKVFVSSDEDLTDRQQAILSKDLQVQTDPAAKILATEMVQGMRSCFSRLPLRQRIVALMVLDRNIPAVEVARTLGISEAAVSQHVHKARKNLRKYFEESGVLAPHLAD